MNGTVQFSTWKAASGPFAAKMVTYDRLNGLAPSFQRENFPVTLVAKVRHDIGGIHMVGPIVEVISIQTR